MKNRTEPTCDNPEPDPHEAEEFLTLLDPCADRFFFQTFDDRNAHGDESLTRTFSGSLEEHWNELNSLNQRGAGIFVAINRVERGCRRRNENIDQIRAVFIDLDNGRLEAVQDELELTPHAIVESSQGNYHVYYLLESPLNKQQFRDVQRNLADRFDTDHIIDPARVMRVPGFVHQKSPKQRFGTSIFSISGHERYAPEEILATVGECGDSENSLQNEQKLFLPKGLEEQEELPEEDRELLLDARNASNGDKFQKLYDEGDFSGYPSHSEADMALVGMLAFWVGRDPHRINRLFRHSALYREKWEEERGSTTYGFHTIEKVLDQMDRDDFHPGANTLRQSDLPDLPSKR